MNVTNFDTPRQTRQANRVRIVGPYELLRCVGAGGMGEVWTARRSSLGGAGKLVAIKLLLPSKALDRKARSMFLDEARLSMLMTNSNIVQVFDAGEAEDGTCYMVMELVDGVDLSMLTSHLEATGSRLSHSVIAYVVGEILNALTYAHEYSGEGLPRTIVHRDVSPQNVMLSVSGEVKLMDFGVARLASEETSGLFVKGKIRYMPPEQIRGKSRAPTVDLFAVGAILYELLECRKFRGDATDESQLLAMCVDGHVPELARPSVPEVFNQLHRGLLAPNPEHRIPSAREAHRLLCRWAGDRGAKFELEELVRPLVRGTSMPLPNSSEVLTAPRIKFRAPALNQVVTQRDTPMAMGGQTEPDAKTQIEPAIAAAPRARRSPPYTFLTVATMAVGVGAALAWKMTFAYDYKADSAEPQVIGRAPEKLELAAPVRLEAEAAENTPESPAALESGPPVPVKVESEPSKVESEPSKVESEPSKVESEPSKVESEPSKVKSKSSPRTEVTIVASGIWAAVMIIGGGEHILDNVEGPTTISVRLKPGEYKLYYRDNPNGGYRDVGRVVIPKSERVELAMLADGTPSITQL
jgi:serine/threonine protein kinase